MEDLIITVIITVVVIIVNRIFFSLLSTLSLPSSPSITRQQLSSTLAELDDVKALYVNICQEAAAQEAELTEKFRQQLEAESRKVPPPIMFTLGLNEFRSWLSEIYY